MSGRHVSRLGDLTSRIPRGGSIVVLGAGQGPGPGPGEDLLEDILRVATGLKVRNPDHFKQAGWDHGPVDLLVVRRDKVVEKLTGSLLATWTQHVGHLGYLALVGWSPVETPSIPPLGMWQGVDGRWWAPVTWEGDFLAYWCVGVPADA